MTTRRVLTLAWPWVMALAVCAPLLAPGYVLTYDMVWVPSLDISSRDLWGLGEALPRAVPSDAVIALLNVILPGQILQKLILVALLAGAGFAAMRLVPSRGTTARLAAASLYVWNPFVVERLTLGQWPLLVAYAALPWVIWLASGATTSSRRARLVLALALTAMTPASGVMGWLAASLATRAQPQQRSRRLVEIAAMALAVNAPWIVAGALRGADTRSDPLAVQFFDVQGEGALGRIGSVLSLGGIWNADVVPTSRTLAVAALFAVVIWAIIASGLDELYRKEWAILRPLVLLGVIGVALALSAWVAPSLVEWVVSAVPGGGLVRDGTRYLALLAPLFAVGFGVGVERIARSVRSVGVRRVTAAFLIVVPLAALPDFVWGVAGRLDPVDYPASWASARDTVDETDSASTLVLPFGAYRAPSWNDGRPVLDPAGRYFDNAVVNDELLVSGRPITGENPQAQRIATVLTGDENRIADGLAAEGITSVVVDLEAGAADMTDLGLVSGFTELDHRGAEQVKVFELEREPTQTAVGTGRRVAVIGSWIVAALSVSSAALSLGWGAVRRRQRSRSER